MGLFSIPRTFIGQFVVPNQRRLVNSEVAKTIEEESNRVVQIYQGRKLDVLTPKGEDLEVFHYLGKNSRTQERMTSINQTIVFCLGMGAYHHYLSGYIEKYNARGINVVTFNYPGVGMSKGVSDCEEIIACSEKIIHHLESQMSIPRNEIALHGHSFGGGIATQVAKRIPGLNIINDRSFSKLSLASRPFFQGNLLSTHSLLGYLGVIENFVNFTFKLTGWELDSEDAWSKIQGKKCVVYHKKDPVVTHENSLFHAIYGRDSETHFEVLKDDCSDPHSRLLTDQEFDRVIQAIGFRNFFLESQEISRPIPLQHAIQIIPLQPSRVNLSHLFWQKVNAIGQTLCSLWNFFYRKITVR
jgi:pimeloyl-ACP methyl ester carboxylesterase